MLLGVIFIVHHTSVKASRQWQKQIVFFRLWSSQCEVLQGLPILNHTVANEIQTTSYLQKVMNTSMELAKSCLSIHHQQANKQKSWRKPPEIIRIIGWLIYHFDFIDSLMQALFTYHVNVWNSWMGITMDLFQICTYEFPAQLLARQLVSRDFFLFFESENVNSKQEFCPRMCVPHAYDIRCACTTSLGLNNY